MLMGAGVAMSESEDYKRGYRLGFQRGEGTGLHHGHSNGVRAERERVEATIAWLENDLYNADCSAGHALGCMRKKLAQLPPRARSESGQSGGEYCCPACNNGTGALCVTARLKLVQKAWEERESRTVLSRTLLGKQVVRVVVDGGARLEPEDLWELAGSIRLYADDISGFRNFRPEPEPCTEDFVDKASDAAVDHFLRSHGIDPEAALQRLMRAIDKGFPKPETNLVEQLMDEINACKECDDRGYTATGYCYHPGRPEPEPEPPQVTSAGTIIDDRVHGPKLTAEDMKMIFYLHNSTYEQSAGVWLEDDEAKQLRDLLNKLYPEGTI